MDQQKILGYFIEEAKEHLETLEQGILELSAVVDDEERVNEMFRAAHSIKGGAAMLGYSSIQKIAHRLEDAFKVLREQKIPVDQKLESLFFGGFDVLQDLVEKLQSTFGLQDDEGAAIVENSESNFVELQKYLTHLLEHGASPQPHTVVASPQIAKATTNTPTQVRILLKQMLETFKHSATPETRQQLQQYCVQLGQLATTQPQWQTLVNLAKTAIANPKHSYRTLAPVIIKELKYASDLMELGKGEEISSSYELQQLATAKLPQILVSIDPQLLANTLRQVLNQQQLSQVANLLQA